MLTQKRSGTLSKYTMGTQIVRLFCVSIAAINVGASWCCLPPRIAPWFASSVTTAELDPDSQLGSSPGKSLVLYLSLIEMNYFKNHLFLGWTDLIRYVVAKYPDAFQDDSDDESRTSHFDDESDDTDSELNEELLSYFSDIMKAMNESSSWQIPHNYIFVVIGQQLRSRYPCVLCSSNLRAELLPYIVESYRE